MKGLWNTPNTKTTNTENNSQANAQPLNMMFPPGKDDSLVSERVSEQEGGSSSVIVPDCSWTEGSQDQNDSLSVDEDAPPQNEKHELDVSKQSKQEMIATEGSIEVDTNDTVEKQQSETDQCCKDNAGNAKQDIITTEGSIEVDTNNTVQEQQAKINQCCDDNALNEICSDAGSTIEGAVGEKNFEVLKATDVDEEENLSSPTKNEHSTDQIKDVAASTQQSDETLDHSGSLLPMSRHEKEIQSLGGEILFESPTTRKSSFSLSNTNGWTNELWLSTKSTRSLCHSGLVTKIEKGRSWGGRLWGEKYEERMLALFTEPSIILLLRRPQNLNEVKKILGLSRDSSRVNDSFWISECVIDPKMCKIRLSNLTTNTSTSVASNDNQSIMKYRSCFELISPSESLLLTVVLPQSQSSLGGKTLNEDDDERSTAFLETYYWEKVLSQTLLSAHNTDSESYEISKDQAWRHQVVLGSLHSHVIMGDNAVLENALSAAQPDSNEDSKCHKVDVDALDEFGRSALHYACSRRSSSAVALLVNAGANCSLPTMRGCKTPCHLSAEQLDEKSLSLILSAPNLARPNPNVLDGSGRTPMHVAAVEGIGVGGARDPVALSLCISSLKAWGGKMMMAEHEIDGRERGTAIPKLRQLDHPLYTLSSQWQTRELAVVLPYCNRQDSLANNLQDTNGMSLSAYFNYPLHAAIFSLRRRALVMKEKNTNPIASSILDEIQGCGASQESELVSTLRLLLNNGFEPNERSESVNKGSLAARADLNCIVGFTPLQVLAAAALDIYSLQCGKVDNIEEKVVQQSSSAKHITEIVANAAELLVLQGARISAGSPPMSRSNRESSGDTSKDDGVVDKGIPFHPRDALKIGGNEVLLELLGGGDRLKRARTKWTLTRNTKGSGRVLLRQKSSSIESSNAPGGSDEKTCAICWRPFGMMINRKHICRASKRYVCEDCSSKRIVEGDEDFRVSDGQFLLARNEAEKLAEINALQRKEKAQERRLRLEKAQSARLRASSSSLSGEKREDIEKEELFGGNIGKAVMNFFSGEEEDADRDEDVGQSLGGLAASLGQTKEAFNERGEKLNTLSDKTAALAGASKDFAEMAKALKESQQGGLFW